MTNINFHHTFQPLYLTLSALCLRFHGSGPPGYGELLFEAQDPVSTPPRTFSWMHNLCTIFKMVPEWIEGTGDNLWLNINMKVQFEGKSPLDLSMSIKLNEGNPVWSLSNLNVTSGSTNSEIKAKIQNCPSLLGHSESLNWIHKQIKLSNCP